MTKGTRKGTTGGEGAYTEMAGIYIPLNWSEINNRLTLKNKEFRRIEHATAASAEQLPDDMDCSNVAICLFRETFSCLSGIHDLVLANMGLSEIFMQSQNWKLTAGRRTTREWEKGGRKRDNGRLRDFLKYRLGVIDEEIFARIYSRVREVRSSRDGIFSDHKFSKYTSNRKARMKIFLGMGRLIHTAGEHAIRRILLILALLEASRRDVAGYMRWHQIHFSAYPRKKGMNNDRNGNYSKLNPPPSVVGSSIRKRSYRG